MSRTRPSGRARASGESRTDGEPEHMNALTVTRRIAGSWALTARAAPGILTLYCLVTLVTGALPVATAWLTKLVLDALVGGASASALVALTAGIAAAAVVTGTLPQATQYLRTEMNRRVGLLAQDRLFTAVEGFTGLGRFENPGFLDRLRIAQQSSDMPNQVVDGALGIARGTITIVGFLLSLTVLSPLMAVLVPLSGVPSLLAEIAMSRRRSRMFWKVGPIERREFFYAELLSSVEAAKEVRLFGIGPLLRRRMTDERRAANAARRTVDRREVAVQAALNLLTALVFGGGLFWAVDAARSGGLSVGDVTVFVAAVTSLQAALAGLARDIARSHHALTMFGHYTAVITAPPDLPLVPRAPAPPRMRYGIELRDVWFRYSEEHPWVLRGVSLRVPHGRTVALVGLNGSGKSTLVKLLCRFYDPTRGSILWDGQDIRDVDVAGLRDRISAVFQDYMHYDMTAAENIALGDPAVWDDRERVRSAAERAGVHDTLAGLPHGYDTPLTRIFFSESEKNDSEVGTMLSGGQWQRLALARALLRDGRDLMILDEPSAGLDAEAEHEIHASLTAHRAERTSLLISHRLSAVRDADLIVVLRDGRIVEQGDHARLMADGGEYARLFALQSSGYRDPAAEGPALTAGGAG
ncbi:ABC transporter ATP-binding protein [Streptosporangium sp. NPDC020145]|uniref:ABC transporter ATP-binding protein n=1 Tax=Streptosporangium sp. NPDC020145 TaxID=3154694 RepID=UPI00341CA3B7